MRRAQVTLFVLLGLALLIIILLGFFLLRPQLRLSEADRERVAPVTSLVEQCLSDRLEQLLRTAGANGGHLNTSTLRHSPLTWSSDTVPFAPQDVAYWSHVVTCPESDLGCEASAQPPLCKRGSPCPLKVDDRLTKGKSIQEQLEQALPGTVDECLDDFSAVSDRFTVERRGPSSAKLLISDERVSATLNLPLQVTEPGSNAAVRLDEYTATADVRLPLIYGLANKYADAERQTAFLERLTLHLLSIYGDIDSAIPPMRAMTLLGQKRYWTRSQVERVLQEEVLPWTGFLQSPNAMANFAPVWPSPTETASLSQDEQTMYAGIFFPLIVKLEEEPYHDDIAAQFFYPGTKPYLSINGGQELLKPRSAETGGFFQKLIGVFLNDYRFKYDLRYPVIVTLTDTSAFNGRGYDWSFALEANIRKNAPLNRSGAASKLVLVDESVDAAAPQQRVQNTIIIAAKDERTGKPLAATSISYQCGDEYFIGETDESGQLATRLPYCRYGGALLYSREGYMGSGILYDNYEEEVTRRLNVGLWPLRAITVTVRKLTGAGDIPLNESDLVIANFARVKAAEYDEDIPLAGFLSLSLQQQNLTADIEAKRLQLEQLKEQGVLTEEDVRAYLDALNQSPTSLQAPPQPTATLLLAPGNYTLDAFLLYNTPFSIPSEKRTYGTFLSKKTVVLPEQNFTSWLSGAASLNGSEPFVLTPEQLYQSTNLTLFVVEQPIPKNWAELEKYKTPAEFLAGMRQKEEPVLG